MTSDHQIGWQNLSVWSIEGSASLQAVLDSPGCPQLLRQTLARTTTWQDRNRRVVRRAIASPNVAPQWSAALLALGATVTLEREDGPAEVLVETILSQRPKGEIVALHVRTEGICWGEAHVARTPADEPIVAAIAGVKLDGGRVSLARVALTGVWAEAVSLTDAAASMVGSPLGEEQIEAVAAAIQKEVCPRGDYLGSEEYRRAMAGVLARRALEQCRQMGTKLQAGGHNDQ